MGSGDLFQVVDSPPRAPGTCFRCRSNRQGPFVDTRVDDPFLGVFYICKGCIVMMYNTLIEAGAITVEAGPTVEMQIAEAANKGFIEGINAIRDSLNDTASYYLDTPGSAIDMPSLPSVSAPFQSENLSTDLKGEAGDGTSADSTGKQTRSVTSVKGRDDVSGDSGNGSAEFDLSSI